MGEEVEKIRVNSALVKDKILQITLVTTTVLVIGIALSFVFFISFLPSEQKETGHIGHIIGIAAVLLVFLLLLGLYFGKKAGNYFLKQQENQ